MGEKRKKKSSRPCFKITLVPYFDNAKENHCSVALQIRYFSKLAYLSFAT